MRQTLKWTKKFTECPSGLFKPFIVFQPFHSSESCKKLLIMQAVLIYRNANKLRLGNAIDSAFL